MCYSNYRMQTKIVIVEDEIPILQLYTMKFELEGFEVHAATNGKDGLKTIEKHQPDLVLLDLRMPNMSGDEMLKRLRETDWGASVRVLILTNLSRNEAPASLQFLGISGYIVKANHTPKQIVDMVRSTLHLKP